VKRIANRTISNVCPSSPGSATPIAAQVASWFEIRSTTPAEHLPDERLAQPAQPA
jgi:hypothetical protein